MSIATLKTTHIQPKEQHLFENVILTTVDDLYYQIRIADLYTSYPEVNCCFMRIAALLAVPQTRSHSANLLITASAITPEFAPTLIRLYEQMSAPKFVMTLGACNATSNSTLQDVNTVIPVNVQLAECPLRSQTILNAIADL
ncbi:NADH dehydrogenase subunit B [Leptolyngbya sp. NIES-3755]|nr:NADH dehydrogenase subunit B [Leptolyngbya sp. NIES-3755]